MSDPTSEQPNPTPGEQAENTSAAVDLSRIVRLLRATVKLARDASLTGAFSGAARTASLQYNQYLHYLEHVNVIPAGFFPPLAAEAEFSDVGFAASMLVGYLEERTNEGAANEQASARSLLKRMVQTAREASMTGAFSGSREVAVSYFNRTLESLAKAGLVPEGFFQPLDPSANFDEVAFSAAQISEFLSEDESGDDDEEGGRHRRHGRHGRHDPFDIQLGIKGNLEESFKRLESLKDLGQTIRMSFPDWMQKEGGPGVGFGFKASTTGEASTDTEQQARREAAEAERAVRDAERQARDAERQARETEREAREVEREARNVSRQIADLGRQIGEIGRRLADPNLSTEERAVLAEQIARLSTAQSNLSSSER